MSVVALKSAARAAIVMPVVFAIADEVIQNPQTALFAAFGSFAVLVFADFTGPLRSQFVAYVVLACVGAANIVAGTWCSRNAWLAAGAMAVVGFATLFSGAINEYFAAAGTAALLTFVLPLTIAAPMSAVPARLEGWALAAGAGIAAHMLLWPARTRAVEHAQVKPVFRDSVRAAVGLAVAVFIAQRMDLQHSFWVVLGTLSVLRSNALSTGWSILSALAGTAVGIVIGAALVIAIGTHHAVLWGVLPFAILLAAYAPRAISFAAGQAGFTVVLFVLFNLIQPSGWRVGLVRLEDVAIGFGVSLGVGLLFWPRGNTDHRLSEGPGFGALGRRIPGRGYSSPWNW